ncbi:MAG: hypothetical protein PHQ36_12965 [Anaerolineales bacterium]|nr:hypothetical protein [Anaerolineales bacterium]
MSKISLKKFDVGKMLIWCAAAFQAYQFGRALNVYDPAGWNIAGVNIGGLILGVIVNVVVVTASTRLPSLKGKSRIWAAWVGFGVLILLSPSLVAPAIYLLLKHLPIDPGWIVFLSIGLSSAPDLAIALSGFVAGKSLVHLLSDDEPPLKKPLSETSGRSAKPSGRSAKGSKPLVLIACRYEGSGCKQTGTQNAMNAHAPHCKFKPTIDDTLMLKTNKNDARPATKSDLKNGGFK